MQSMASHRRHVLGALIVGLTLVAAGCGNSGSDGTSGESNGSVTIGAFLPSESKILAGMYEGALQAEGIAVTVRSNLGSREDMQLALERGEIDLYPGYAATELEFVNNKAGEATPDVEATVDKLRERLGPKGATALAPSDAIDANAFAVTKATADKFNLRTLSDVVPVANQLTLGGPLDCPTDPFCQAGLEQAYGLAFKGFLPLDAGGPLTKTNLDQGTVDIALILSSDGAIPAKGYVVLEDDKRLQNADNIVPIIRTKAATERVRKVLDRVSTLLTTEELAALNKRADIDREDPAVLAAEWLTDNGFLED